MRKPSDALIVVALALPWGAAMILACAGAALVGLAARTLAAYSVAVAAPADPEMWVM